MQRLLRERHLVWGQAHQQYNYEKMLLEIDVDHWQ
jgi:hypothetical protein